MKPLFQNFQFLMTASISYNFRIVLSFMDVYFPHTQLSRNKMFFLTSASNDGFVFHYYILLHYQISFVHSWHLFLFSVYSGFTLNLLFTLNIQSEQSPIQISSCRSFLKVVILLYSEHLWVKYAQLYNYRHVPCRWTNITEQQSNTIQWKLYFINFNIFSQLVHALFYRSHSTVNNFFWWQQFYF